VSPPEHNLATLLVGRWVAEGHGRREAVVDEQGRWTFDDLDAAARRAAGGLRAAGVAPGDRVMVALRDGRPWVQAFLGAAVLGAVAVPADPTEPERLALLAEDCEPEE
jgi:acyl-CoA synthetase (AMP-forming)/AMP-acid ligase II